MVEAVALEEGAIPEGDVHQCCSCRAPGRGVDLSQLAAALTAMPTMRYSHSHALVLLFGVCLVNTTGTAQVWETVTGRYLFLAVMQLFGNSDAVQGVTVHRRHTPTNLSSDADSIPWLTTWPDPSALWPTSELPISSSVGKPTAVP